MVSLNEASSIICVTNSSSSIMFSSFSIFSNSCVRCLSFLSGSTSLHAPLGVTHVASPHNPRSLLSCWDLWSLWLFVPHASIVCSKNPRIRLQDYLDSFHDGLAPLGIGSIFGCQDSLFVRRPLHYRILWSPSEMMWYTVVLGWQDVTLILARRSVDPSSHPRSWL